jgi:hypothetical protein
MSEFLPIAANLINDMSQMLPYIDIIASSGLLTAFDSDIHAALGDERTRCAGGMKRRPHFAFCCENFVQANSLIALVQLLSALHSAGTLDSGDSKTIKDAEVDRSRLVQHMIAKSSKYCIDHMKRCVTGMDRSKCNPSSIAEVLDKYFSGTDGCSTRCHPAEQFITQVFTDVKNSHNEEYVKPLLIQIQELEDSNTDLRDTVDANADKILDLYVQDQAKNAKYELDMKSLQACVDSQDVEIRQLQSTIMHLEGQLRESKVKFRQFLDKLEAEEISERENAVAEVDAQSSFTKAFMFAFSCATDNAGDGNKVSK